MEGIVTSNPCDKCGAMIFPDAAFCHACGAKVGADLPGEVETGRLGRLKSALAGTGESMRAIVNDPDNRRAASDFVSGAAEGAGEVAKDLLASPATKKVAGGALLGASVAAILPVVTLTAGAVVGAALVGYKLLTRKED